MDLHTYLTKHDGGVRAHGPELIRLAEAAGMSPYYLYLVALGHKRVGDVRAFRLQEASLGRELTAEEVNKPK